jgi:alpha-1,3/alpha-1,6-mannosyltransferase
MFMAWKVWSGSTPDYDVIIVDQVAAVVPLLKLLLQGTQILFYCHFPDLLLTQRTSLLKAVYRAPLDALEESATGMSDLLLVNSGFTAGVFSKTFHHLAVRGVRPAVLYPAVAIPPSEELKAAAAAWESELDPELVKLVKGKPMFLSINRYSIGLSACDHSQFTRKMTQGSKPHSLQGDIVA